MENEFLVCADASEWERWLADHHTEATEVWVRIAKKRAPDRSVTITETLDGALCFGWIDSHRRRWDEHHYLQRYSPRRAGSPWSQVNVAKAEALIAAGRMRPAGFAAIAAARADGRWDTAYERQRTAHTPDDLTAALDTAPDLRAVYDTLTKSARYGIYLPLLKARTIEERATRLRQAMAALRSHVR